MTKKELKDLKSLFIDSYIDDYVPGFYHKEAVTDLDNLCNVFIEHQNEELIEEKSKTIRFLADKLEVEQLKNKELISNHESILQLLSDVINDKIDFDRQTVKERLEKYIEANKSN